MDKVKCINCDRKHTCKPKLNEIKLLECYVYPLTIKVKRRIKPKIEKTLIVKVDKVEFNVMD